MEVSKYNLGLYSQVRFALQKKSDNDGNHPSDFESLTPTEKEALLYWIPKAMGHSKQYDDRSSYGLKHDFEHEAFYITNGQFKGAMLLLGHEPKDKTDLNWTFKICRLYTRKSTKQLDPHDYQDRYSLAGFDKDFAKLLLASGHL